METQQTRLPRSLHVREIRGHEINAINAQIRITSDEEAINYSIRTEAPAPAPSFWTDIKFQSGPVADCGVNGLTNEVLLTVIADRLETFQKGGRSCRENDMALIKVQEALHWLIHRVRARAEGSTRR
jgi:hypothetical protein